MEWAIEFTNKAAKQVATLSHLTVASLRLLVEDLQQNGPFPGKSGAITAN